MRVFGIDLGTTNSVIAELVEGVPRAIPVDGDPIVPSVVLYAEDGRVIVGREARNLALLHPDRVVRSVKRRMGQAEPIMVAGRALLPEQVSAEILRALASAAQVATGEPVRDVVITVPAYFNDAQRRATLAAGELAGLHVLRLLNEPTAASLVYDHVGEVGDSTELMLVYDLGGGTFDVSVLEVFGDIREVRSTTGDTTLGGDDFDDALVERFVDELRALGATDLSGPSGPRTNLSGPSGPRTNLDAATLARLQRAAETAKIALSRELEVEVREEFIATVDAKPIHLELTLTRREFEAAIEGMLRSTIELAKRAIDDAKLRADERIAKVCLVGGSTRIPRIRTLLAEAFDADIHEEIDVDLAVGLGAAIQCGMLLGVECRHVLVDVAAHTLGVRAVRESDQEELYFGEESDFFAPVLHRNTALPAERTEEFYTMVDDQEVVQVEVFQGESSRCSQNTLVGSFDFELEPAPHTTPIRCRIAYDLDGIVRVTASQAGGPEKTVALKLPDAGAPATPMPVAPAQSDSALIRRATRLLDTAQGEAREQLSKLIAAWQHAEPHARTDIEDELLDVFLALEAED